jgi:hypothetical protein
MEYGVLIVKVDRGLSGLGVFHSVIVKIYVHVIDVRVDDNEVLLVEVYLLVLKLLLVHLWYSLVDHRRALVRPCLWYHWVDYRLCDSVP